MGAIIQMVLTMPLIGLPKKLGYKVCLQYTSSRYNHLGFPTINGGGTDDGGDGFPYEAGDASSYTEGVSRSK